MRPGAAAPHRRWVNHAVAREVDRHRLRWIGAGTLAACLAASPLAFYVMQKSECVSLSYELNRLRDEQERLAEAERRLRMRRTAGESLDAVEDWVARQGELSRPLPPQVIVLERAPGETARGTGR
jgi:hypothetical protein